MFSQDGSWRITKNVNYEFLESLEKEIKTES